MSRTESERQFEAYCDANDVSWRRIPRSSNRTPDYEIACGGVQLICEVKQLETSRAERAVLERAFSEGRAVAYFPKNRLRAKLYKAAGQLDMAARKGIPTMLVVVDNGLFRSDLHHSRVAAALFGSLRYPVRFPDDPEAEVVAGDPILSNDGAFAPRRNLSVSALAVLESAASVPVLRVYHNLWAAVPLDPAILPAHSVDQRVLPGDTHILFEDTGGSA